MRSKRLLIQSLLEAASDAAMAGFAPQLANGNFDGPAIDAGDPDLDLIQHRYFAHDLSSA